MSGEFERIARLSRRLAPQPVPAWLRLGIGDDAAVLDLGGGAPLVWTVDEQVEGTHFRTSWLSLADLGYRATMAAASDVLAMGARPLAALAAVVVPEGATDEALDALSEGQAEAARVLGAPIVGGNLARGERWSVTTTFLGRAVHAPWTRAGAREGDRVFVAGTLGRAAAGLRSLLNGKLDAPGTDLWRRPSLPLEVARTLAENANLVHASIDVSDGLAQDLGHLTTASGCGLVLSGEALDAFVSKEYGVTLDDVLFGGEEYALVCTSGAPLEDEGLVAIGRVVAGAGLFLERAGAVEPLAARGFDHFARP
jgi:thiamine-monophosphate kinase